MERGICPRYFGKGEKRKFLPVPIQIFSDTMHNAFGYLRNVLKLFWNLHTLHVEPIANTLYSRVVRGIRSKRLYWKCLVYELISKWIIWMTVISILHLFASIINPTISNSRIYINIFVQIYIGRVAQSVQRLSYGLDGPGVPVGARFSARPDRFWGPPSLLYNGYWVFPGGKVRPGSAADHSPPSSAAVMEE